MPQRQEPLQHSDVDLVRLARSGNREAFGALVMRHRNTALALSTRLLRNHDLAEEAVQEAVLQALLNLESLRRPERFGSWFAGIALNVSRRSLGEQSAAWWSWEAVMGGRPAWQGSAAEDPQELAASAELSGKVRAAVAGLPKGQRGAILLFYLAGLTYREAAAALGIEVGTLKTRLHKGRRALRRELWALWKEEAMRAKPKDSSVEVYVADVLAKPMGDDATRRHIVLLVEKDGERRLAIWVGQAEGAAIALELEKVKVPRPLTFQFAASVLAACGGRLTRVLISRLADETFYAEAEIEGPGGTRIVDARPSDAIALALVVGARIAVTPEVFDSAAQWETTHPEEAQLPERVGGAARIVEEVRSRWPQH